MKERERIDGRRERPPKVSSGPFQKAVVEGRSHEGPYKAGLRAWSRSTWWARGDGGLEGPGAGHIMSGQ